MSSGLAKNKEGQIKGYDIFVRNLKENTTSEELADFFREAGKILGRPRLQLARGFAWIRFDSPAAVEEAVSWSGCYFGSRIIYIEAAKSIHTGTSVQQAGKHIPALCEETVQKMVAPDAGGVYVDGTFGRGGHSKAMLAAMSPSGRLHAFDMDPEAIKVGKELMKEDSRFTIHHAPFSSMKEILGALGISPGSVAGVFMDLGISSPQFDDTGRGFRPEADGPLDLRFDISKGVPASEFLKTVDHSELVRILAEYGEVAPGGHSARRIADVICLARLRGELPTRTKPFAELVARVRGKEHSGQVMHPAKMTFQALRIHLNDEFEEFRKGMRAAFKLLGIGGRIGIISWKFSERDILEEMFRPLEAVKPDEPLLKWYQEQPEACSLPEGPSLEDDEVVRPSESELQRNSRSRVALLHVLHKRKKPRLAQLEKRAYALPGWADAVAPGGEDQGRPKDTKEAKRKKKDDDEDPEAPRRKPKKSNTGAI
eukprot:TRINITY_DN37173_c0_g1_i2.p1 TRINITY_DN37173_c0_g1~~TRINITY_DN37173_c0_g1_i2.p1  ORF type:complete len:484 (+),score=97.33 TRINITY_DN37173_c0_g1_i2:75-1526(+)